MRMLKKKEVKAVRSICVEGEKENKELGEIEGGDEGGTIREEDDFEKKYEEGHPKGRVSNAEGEGDPIW